MVTVLVMSSVRTKVVGCQVTRLVMRHTSTLPMIYFRFRAVVPWGRDPSPLIFGEVTFGMVITGFQALERGFKTLFSLDGEHQNPTLRLQPQCLVPAGPLSSSVLGEAFDPSAQGSARQVEVDVDLLRLEDGDRLLLCSDGLTDGVDDDTIAATLGGGLSSGEVCHRLLQRALDSGGHDNITVIAATFGFPARAT